MMAWMRRVWLALALALLVAYIVSIPAYYRQLASEVTDPQSVEGAEMLALLDEIGMSPAGYAAYQVATRASWFLPYCLVGLLLFARRRDDWRNLGMASLLVLMGTGGGSISAPARPDSIANALALGLQAISSMAGPVLLYTFPDGRFVPRWTVWLAAGTLPVITLNTFFANTALDPFHYPWLTTVYGLSTLASFFIAPAYRYFRVANAVQRQQMKWALLGLAATPLAFIGGEVYSLLFSEAGTAQGLRADLAYTAFSTALFLLGPLAISFAVLRYRLFDIDVIIRRTLIYSVLTGLLGLAYFGSVLVLQPLLTRLSGQGSALANVISTLIVASLFGPLRRRVQRAIDRRFFRQKYDAARTLAGFAASARDETDLGRLSEQLVGVVDNTMQPESVGLWLRTGRGTATSEGRGEPGRAELQSVRTAEGPVRSTRA